MPEPVRLPRLTIASSPSKPRADHVLLHAVQGWGKTSLGAHAPKPVFLMTKNETGLITLIQREQLPPTPWIRFPRGNGRFSEEAETWTEALNAIQALTAEDQPYQVLVLDTLNGLERLCHEHVCAASYENDWGEKGFLGFQRGYETALHEWRRLLHLLDRLREQRNIGTFALCHTQVKTQANPLGPDFDRYIPAMHRKSWDLTHGWADLCLFGKFHVEVFSEKGKAKGKGGSLRVLYTTYSAAWDAKNRHGLPEELVMGEDAQDSWAILAQALTHGSDDQAS